MKSFGWFGLGALAGLVLTGAAVAVIDQGWRVELAQQRAAIRDTYVRDSTRFDTERRQWVASADSLQRVRVAQDSGIANAERTTARLRDRLRAVRADTAWVDTLRVVVQQDSLIDALTTENATLRIALHTETMRGSALTLALAASDSALAAERVRAGALDALVRARLPAPPGKLLGFLPKPSRGALFVAGLAIGVAATR